MKKIFLLCFLLLAIGASARERAGKVIAVEGRAYAITEDKGQRRLVRGAPIFTGETMIVDDHSRMQIKLTDGGILNLLPDTEYKINSYVYGDKRRRNEYTGALVVGGFRHVTGNIARENPENFLIETPVATIGVRGTTIQAFYRKGKLFAECLDGLAFVLNKGGEVEIGPNAEFQAVGVTSADAMPTELSTSPPELQNQNFSSPSGGFSSEVSDPGIAPSETETIIIIEGGC